MKENIKIVIVAVAIIYLGVLVKMYCTGDFKWEVALIGLIGYGYGIKRMADGNKQISIALLLISTVLMVVTFFGITIG